MEKSEFHHALHDWLLFGDALRVTKRLESQYAEPAGIVKGLRSLTAGCAGDFIPSYHDQSLLFKVCF